MKNSLFILGINTNFLFCSLRVFVLAFHCFIVKAQNCPKNIDFETGTFDGWTCYIGFVIDQGTKNIITLAPAGEPFKNRQTMYASSPGDGLDPYGKFPINCPNGSGHSVRLGNDEGQALAEGLSYDFKIPLDRNRFTIVYHYAIVFQESPHLEYQQPRFEVQVTNLTRNEVISCSSFEFHPFGPLTPGFKIAPQLVNKVPLWYKEWTTASINLNDHAGETIRLFFKTADCTYFDHFGYAYIDVDSECNAEFTAAKYCPGDTLVNFSAPADYRNYRWYNNTFTQVLGSAQTISVSPQVIGETSLPVEVVPNFGYGCIDTFYAKATPTLTVKANAGNDVICCNNDSVLIGDIPITSLVYSWQPSQGLSDAAVSNPLANPAFPTTYIITANSIGGGCVNHDTVFVNTSFINDSLQVVGKLNYCRGHNDSLLLRVLNIDSVQWFRDNFKINRANQEEYKPVEAGTYYAVLVNNNGCSIVTPKKIVHIDEPKQGISYPVKYVITDIPTNLDARNFGSSILWKPASGLNNPNVISPVFTGNKDQSYTITITTTGGCQTVDTQMVKIVSHADIYVPTAFSPNQDGLNDILRPVLIGIKEFHYFKIFGRWGNLLFETKNAEAGWDGKIKASPQSSQVVVWVAEGIGWDNKIYSKKGVSTILR